MELSVCIITVFIWLVQIIFSLFHIIFFVGNNFPLRAFFGVFRRGCKETAEK